MNHVVSVPRNDLERLILDVQSGQLDAEEFAKHILSEQVFLPVKDEKHKIAGFQSSTKAEPLVIDDDEGNRVMLLFSAPEQAKTFLNEYPDYSGGLVVEFAWVLRRMGPELGIALNPGNDIGFDFDAEMVAMLASLLPEQAQ
jgi:hypothetical protein